MRKFKKIMIPPQWKEYWTAYPHGYTILEALVDWLSEFNDIIDNINDLNKYMDDFIKTWQKDLQQEVARTLQEWRESGFLEDIILEVYGNKLDEIDKRIDFIDQRFVNIAWLGAKGDGITDNTQIFENALAEYNTIYIPNGEYIVNGLEIPANKRLIGENINKTILKSRTGNVLKGKGLYITLESMTIEVAGGVTTTVADFRDCRYLTIDDVRIIQDMNNDENKKAVLLDIGLNENTWNGYITIRNSYFLGGDTGILKLESGLLSFVLIENCVISHNYSWGVNLRGLQVGTISTCDIANNGQNRSNLPPETAGGIKIIGGRFITIKDIWCEYNMVNDRSGYNNICLVDCEPTITIDNVRELSNKYGYIPLDQLKNSNYDPHLYPAQYYNHVIVPLTGEEKDGYHNYISDSTRNYKFRTQGLSNGDRVTLFAYVKPNDRTSRVAMNNQDNYSGENAYASNMAPGEWQRIMIRGLVTDKDKFVVAIIGCEVAGLSLVKGDYPRLTQNMTNDNYILMRDVSAPSDLYKVYVSNGELVTEQA